VVELKRMKECQCVKTEDDFYNFPELQGKGNMLKNVVSNYLPPRI
jgi:hypothetical protein